jgi:hypothetical protein
MAGVFADGWVWSRTAGTAATLTGSKGASSQILTLPATKTGGATGTWVGVYEATLASLGWVAGDIVIAEMQVDASSLYGMSEISIALCDVQSTTISQTKSVFANNNNGGFENGSSFSAPLSSAALNIGASNAAVDRLQIRITLSGSPANTPAGMGFIVTLSSASLRKVN